MFPLVLGIDEKQLLEEFHGANHTSPDAQTNWMNAVGLLSTKPIFDGIPFFRVSFFDARKQTIIAVDTGVLKINSHSRYYGEVLYLLCEASAPPIAATGSRTPQTPYMSSGPYELTISSDNEKLLVNPAVQPLSGRYDIFKFALRSEHAETHEDILRLRFTVPETVASAYRPVFDIPVTAVRSLGPMLLRALVAIVLILSWVGLNHLDDLKAFVGEELSGFISQFSLVFFAFSVIDLAKYARDVWMGR
jgi:hypothetical protein